MCDILYYIIQCVLVLVTVGGDKGSGHFLLAGEERSVSELGPKYGYPTLPCCYLFVSLRVAALMDGKGGGRKGRYQGKVGKLEARDQVKTLLVQSLEQ